MKVSELIKELQYSVEAYGDLDVSLQISEEKENGKILDTETILINYMQLEHKDEICIRNFPY